MTTKASPFRVEDSGTSAGRFLVATQDIEEDELILTEEAFVVGPFTISVPICLACNMSLVGRPEDSQWCPNGCGFQLCKNCSSMGRKNGGNKDWHQLECRMIQKSPNATAATYAASAGR